jgi:adenine-specific DNA-methyltransferase
MGRRRSTLKYLRPKPGRVERAVLNARILVDQMRRVAQRRIFDLEGSESRQWIEVRDWISSRIGPSTFALQTFANQTAYSFVLKLMIHEIVRDRYGLSTPKRPTVSAYQEAFAEAHRKTKLDAFQATPLDQMLEGANHDTESILLKTLATIESFRGAQADLIGRLYQDLVPPEDRRKLGEFYTPKPIARFMAQWVIRSSSDTYLDPACGSGGFLIEGYYRFLELGLASKRAIDRIRGFDYNPLAVEMSTANLLLLEPDCAPKIELRDFLKSSPDGKSSGLSCNPPYSRHHELKGDYKEEIAESLGHEAGRRLSRLSSVYVYFLVHAIRWVQAKGRIAFITPNDFLDVEYGIALKEFLLSSCEIDALLLFDENNLVFPGTLTTACITLLKEGPKKTNAEPAVVRLKSWPESTSELTDLIEGRLPSMKGVELTRVPKQSLVAAQKWTHLGEVFTSHSKNTVLLRELASVNRGIATGANDFFILSDAEVKKWEIGRQYLKAILTNSRLVPRLDFTQDDFEHLRASGQKVWLLDIEVPFAELKGDPVSKYLQLGIDRGIAERYLTRTRDRWYSQEKRASPPIIFPLMIRQNPRFVYNRIGVAVSNNIHCVYPRDDIARSDEQTKALLAVLNSSFIHGQLPRLGRSYGGGLLKLEPKEVMSLPVVDIRRLPAREIKEMADSFESVCKGLRSGAVGKSDEARAGLDHLVESYVA